MNKKIFTTILVIVMIASMMVLTVGCGGKDAEPKNTQPEQGGTASAGEMNQPDGMDAEGLQSWSLEAKAWSDGNGATVTFTAVPAENVEGLRASLSVRVGELEAESTNCNWDGAAFTGSVELGATDGYSFFCVLNGPDGSQNEVELNSPEKVTDETLVYLGSSLSTYANMVVEDWEANGSTLNIKSAHIHAQMPRLTFDNTIPSVTGASLILKRNDQEVDRKAVTLDAGEGIGSFETTIVGQSFTMPGMEEDSQLDLWLEVTLSTGDTVSVSGGSWYSSDGQLQLVVG